MFIAAEKRVSINKSIVPNQRDSIQFDGKAYLGLADVGNSFAEDILEKYVDESWFDVRLKLISLEPSGQCVLNSRGYVPIDGRLTINKNSKTGNFTGEALLSNDVWLRIAGDLTNNQKNLVLKCECIDGVVEIQDANSITCRVQISLSEYTLEFHLV
jgi:hypothetical protein